MSALRDKLAAADSVILRLRPCTRRRHAARSSTLPTHEAGPFGQLRRSASGAVRGGGAVLNRCADLPLWSSHVSAVQPRPSRERHCMDKDEELKSGKTEEQTAILHQAAVIEHLMRLAKRQDKRLDTLEALADGDARPPKKCSVPASGCSSDNIQVVRPPAALISATWYEWYCRGLRLWQVAGERQRKPDARMLVAYMKLFLDNLELDESQSTYRAAVISIGEKKERCLTGFLGDRGISERGSQLVLKHIPSLHKDGAVNALILQHKRVLRSGRFSDPAPPFTRDITEPVKE